MTFLTLEQLMKNDTYKMLLQKSEQDYFTKDKVKMPSISKIQNLLQDIGIEVFETYEKDTLKVGRIPNYIYRADGTPIQHGYGYEIKFSTRDGYYSRNTPIHAKKVIDYIENWIGKK